MTDTITCVLVEQDGTMLPIAVTAPSYKSLQKFVDGLFDIVVARHYTSGLPFDVDVWVNDEGLYREDFHQNVAATLLTGAGLVGPAVLAMSTPDGETVGFTAEQLAAIADAWPLDATATPLTFEQVHEQRIIRWATADS